MDADFFNHSIVMSRRAKGSVPASGTLPFALRDRSCVMEQLKNSASLMADLSTVLAFVYTLPSSFLDIPVVRLFCEMR